VVKFTLPGFHTGLTVAAGAARENRERMSGAEKVWRLVVIAALLSLGPLAWLQWRWTGEISQAQSERLREWMQQGAVRLAQDYETALFEQVRAVMRSGTIPQSSWFVSFSVTPIPRSGPWEIAIPRGPRGPGEEWVILELNPRQMREEIWPALIERQWPGVERAAVEVRVVERPAAGGVIFSTPGWQAGIPHDAEVGLRVPGMPGRPPRDPRDPGGPDFFPGPAREGRQMSVQVQSKNGGLAIAARRLRIRNLALSGAILLVLLASMAALAWSTRRAQRLAQLQLEFVAGVSHELRTPLTVIRSAGENLADGVVSKPEAVARYGAVVRDEGMRLSGMVEQILSYAGVESGRWRPARERFDLAELAGSSGVFVKGDRLAIGQCVRNLVDNAERHGWGLESLRVETEGGKARVIVEDSGDGLEPAEMERLFEPFYRGSRSREKQIKGFGLGLALVRRIVETHGGRIWAENRKEGGARFTMELPLDTENVETDSTHRG